MTLRLTFRLKTILGVAAIEALLLSLLVASGVHFIGQSAEAEFERRNQATVKAFSVMAKDALIASDLAALKALTREMLTYPGVVYARVRDAEAGLLVGASASADGDSGAGPATAPASVSEAPRLADVTDGVLRTGREIRVGEQLFGRVEIGVSAGEVQSLKATAQRYGLALGTLEMALVALFSWLLGAYLTRQLAQLAQASRHIAEGELGYQMPVRGSDELADTAQAFNRMSLRLVDSYADVRRNEQNLRRVLETIQDGILTLDAAQRILSASPAALRLLQREAGALLGRPLADCFALGDAGTLDALLAEPPADAQGLADPPVLEAWLPDGGLRPLEVRASPIEGAGQARRLVVLRDVSARIKSAQAIARSEEQLRRVLNATHDGIVVIDETGMVLSFNAGAERLFGWRADELLGRNVSTLVPEPHRAQHDGYLRRYLATGVSHILGEEREFEARRQDGSAIWIALRVGLLDDGAATPKRFIGVVHDITQRKHAELELRQAKEAAEDAAIAKSEFLASMSHEIRTPMHGVLGSIEMLEDTALTGQQQRYLETARTSAGMLLGVIDEILDFSRLEAGKLRIELLDFDLRRSVEDVTAMLAQRAHGKKLELACYIAPEVPELLRGDPIRLRQVLVNLVGNAIKFTERGEVVVSVSAVPAPPTEDAGAASITSVSSVSSVTNAMPARRLRIEVRDTGIGIAPEKQKRLFQPFTQADSSMSRRFGGSGLGLSIAKRLVELMHGAIGFESRPDHGSRFWFTLPLEAATAGSRDVRSRAFAGTRVLVVDDNATNRIILHRYLTAWGSQSGSASSGEEALAKLQDAAASGQPYEIALLDLNMPGMDGYALVQAIRDDPALAGLPLVMLSSSVQEAERVAQAAVDVWLDKPLRQSDLHDAIATLLHRRVPPSGPAPEGYGAGLHFAGEQVLLVEDNPVTQDLGLQMLRRRGLAVSLADNGQQAVEAVRRQRFDLVLMDIQMPELDGYAATRAIRAWERETGRAPLPIIALTAHALPSDRERCLDAGMDDYIVKPYSAQALTSVVARWLMPPGQGTATAAVPAQRVEEAQGAVDDAIDRQRYDQVAALMGSAMPGLLDKVIETLQRERELIDAAARARDRVALRELFHRLKNTAGDIGATRVYDLAAGSERRLAATPEGDPAWLDPAGLTALEVACTAALGALLRLRDAAAVASSPQ